MVERWLQEAWDSARQAWPRLELTREDFLAYLVERWPAGAPMVASQAGDLYLAFGCSLGNRAALDGFEQLLASSEVDTALARFRRGEDFATEVRQCVRERLLVGPRPRILDYRGTGAIQGWIRSTAVRVALNLIRSTRNRRAAELRASGDDPELLLPQPEIEALRNRHKADVEAAVRAAIDRLTPRERYFLRLHHLDGVSFQQIGRAHNVDRSTASRWVAEARGRLLRETKLELERRLQLTPESLQVLISSVEDRIELSLTGLRNVEPA